MVLRAARALRAAGLDVTVVSVAPIDLPGLRVLRDRYEVGPLGGLATILDTGARRFFLAGADMPFLDPYSVKRMRTNFDGRCLVPLRPSGELEVLHAIYAGVDRRAVEALLRRRAGLKTLVAEEARRGNVRFLGLRGFPPETFVDLDTPADYARWTHRATASRPSTLRPQAPETPRSRSQATLVGSVADSCVNDP